MNDIKSIDTCYKPLVYVLSLNQDHLIMKCIVYPMKLKTFKSTFTPDNTKKANQYAVRARICF